MNIVILDDYQDAVRKLHCASRLDPYTAKVYTNTVKGLGQLSVRLKDADVIVLIRERTQITRQLVELMDGKISVVSQENRGTTFSVDITLEQQDSAGVEPDVAEMETLRELKGTRILVVDDNEVTLKSMTSLLGIWTITRSTSQRRSMRRP